MSEPWARFVGNVEGGKVRPFDKDRLQGVMLALQGKRVELAIREEPKDRTLSQNGHIHVLTRALSDYTGETELRTRRMATLAALGAEVALRRDTVLGIETVDVRGTSELTKAEGSKVIDWLLQQCSFCGVIPPKPEHVEVIA
jgi:hypothetical protein